MSSQRFICFPIWLVVSSFSAGSNSFVPPRDTSLVSQSGWWCPALWLSPIHLFPACGNSFVSQSGWWCPAFYAVCCLQFICLPLWQLICLPVWLVVSGSLAVSKSFVSPCGNSFPKQFTVGVLNSILKCVRLVSGAVSASGRFVFQFICLPIHLSPRSCVRGCVRLRGICLPIHLSPNSFVSQFICLPGPVSGAVSASGGFVSQFICPPCVRGCVRLRTICLPIRVSPNSFVSQVLVSQFICLPGPVAGAVFASGGLVSQFICLPIHLSPRSCVRGCVRLRGICLPIHLSPNSFVSQVLCQGLCPPPGDLSPNSFVRLVSGAVSASGRFVSQFICLPCICLPGPCLPIHLSPRSCGRGCVRLRGIGFPIHLSPNSFVSQVLCQGLCPPSGDLSPNSFVFHQSPNSLLLAFSILFQAVSGYVQLVVSGSPDVPNSFVPFWQFICLPIWLVVSSSLAVSNSFVCPYINSFVSQSGWWCPALRLSPIHLSPLVATHLSPNLAGGVRLWLSPIHLSCLVATHLSPSLAGGVRLFGCLSHAGDVRLFGCL